MGAAGGEADPRRNLDRAPRPARASGKPHLAHVQELRAALLTQVRRDNAFEALQGVGQRIPDGSDDCPLISMRTADRFFDHGIDDAELVQILGRQALT